MDRNEDFVNPFQLFGMALLHRKLNIYLGFFCSSSPQEHVVLPSKSSSSIH